MNVGEQFSGSGLYHRTAGTLETSSLYIGDETDAEFTQWDGTTHVYGDVGEQGVIIGRQRHIIDGEVHRGDGKLNIWGGTFDVAGKLQVGYNGFGEVDQSGTDVNVGGDVILGTFGFGSGDYSLTNGKLTVGRETGCRRERS